MTEHVYKTTLTWTGNQGEGTSGYKAYTRDYDVECEGKAVIRGSSDPNYFGDANRHNPEELLLAALSACHMLWYLHLCAVNRVVVTGYQDRAEGEMEMSRDGSGQFTGVTLRPQVTITADSDAARAGQLHERAGALCNIAKSVNFPVKHEASVKVT